MAGPKSIFAAPDPDPDIIWREPQPPGLILVLSDGKRSRILDYEGWDLQGLDDNGHERDLDGHPPGLWIVEAAIRCHCDYWGEWDSELEVTSSRPLTEDEWDLYFDGCDPGQGPWNTADWLVED